MEGGIPVGILKRFLAGIVSFSLLLSLSGGALAATRAVGFTMGVYVTAGLSGSCYRLDPLPGDETGENYLRYTSAVPALAQENDANLFFDLGNRPEDMPTFAEERIEPIALCLRYGSFFLLPGIWEAPPGTIPGGMWRPFGLREGGRRRIFPLWSTAWALAWPSLKCVLSAWRRLPNGRAP